MATKPAHVTDLDDADAEKAQQQERKGAQPATAPASEPEAAAGKPATENAPKAPRPVLASVRDPNLPFEDDPKKVLVGISAEKQADYMRKVPCHVIESFKGRAMGKGGRSVPFAFVRHEVVMLPKWFALSHPTRLVIKE